MTDQYSPEQFDAGAERPPSNWLTWGKIGDCIRGYLLSVREEEGKYGVQKVYEIEAEAGFFHLITNKTQVASEATVLKPGEVWQVNGRSIIDKAMRNAEVGQLVVMRYESDYEAENGSAKTITTKLGAKRNTAQESI